MSQQSRRLIAALGALVVVAAAIPVIGQTSLITPTTAPAASPLAKWTTPAPSPWPVDQTIPQPWGVQLKEGNFDTGNVERVHQLGLKYVRRGFIWAGVEKTQAVYDFSRYEQLVADCRERGMSVIATLGLGNPLYGKVHVKDEPAHGAYVKYAAAAAAKFKGQPVLFEIWNEPNVRFWGNYDKSNGEHYAADYTALVKDTVPAMRAADPNCIIMAGSVSNVWSQSFNWIEYCFKDGILDTGIDAWSLHPYGPKNPEDYIAAYDIVRKLMKDHGKGKQVPLLNSERGFPLEKKEGYNGGAPSKAKEFQANHLVRQYLIDQLCGIKLTSWYEWSGKESFSLIEGDNHFPAYDACKVLLDQLNGYHLDTRLPTASDRDFVLRWVNKSGGVKLVAWTSPPAGLPSDNTVPHAIDISTGSSAAALNTVQLYGQEGSVEAKNGAIHLMLSGAPQYVVVSGK